MSQPATSTNKGQDPGADPDLAGREVQSRLPGGRGGRRFVPATATPLSDVQSSAQFSCRSLLSVRSAASSHRDEKREPTRAARAGITGGQRARTVSMLRPGPASRPRQA